VNSANKTFCKSCHANKRAVAAVDGIVTFKLLPPDGQAVSNVKILRDNTDISSLIAADGTVTLTNINADTDIVVRF